MDDSKSQATAVLVVQDEYLIMDTATLLEAAGFVVFEAENATDAIGRIELHEEIRVVLQT